VGCSRDGSAGGLAHELTRRVSSPSPAVTPPPGQPRFAGLDALRAFAIVAVVFCHSVGIDGTWTKTSWGWIAYYAQAGVSVFLVLSGFLIYRPFAAAHADRRHGPALARYARRRVLRIVPAYWVALTVLSLWPGTQGTFTGDWWRYYFFLQNYWRASQFEGLGGVMWSLGAEVAFYAVLPLLALLAARLAGRWRSERWWHGELVVIAAFGLISPLLVFTVEPLSAELTGGLLFPGFLASGLPGVTDWFAAGMGLAVLSVAAARHDGRARRATAAIGRHAPWLWGLAVVAWLVYARAEWVLGVHLWTPMLTHLAEGLAAVCVVAPVVFVAARAPVGRLTRWRPLALLGLISYGIYLWHVPLLYWLAGSDERLAAGPDLLEHPWPGLTLFVGTMALSVAVAIVSYRVVELPFLRRKEGPRRPTRRSAPSPASEA